MTKKIVIIVSLFLLIGCIEDKKNIPDNFDFGRIEGHVYTNKFFNFKISTNPDWYILNQSQLNNIVDNGVEYILDNNQDNTVKEEFEASKVNLANLFGVYKNEFGTTDEFNPSIAINAENLKDFPNITETDDYLHQAKEMMENTGMVIRYLEEDKKVKIDSKDFVLITIENDSFGPTIQQEFYSTLINNFALNIVLSYQKEEDEKELHKILSTLKFYK